MLHRLKRRLFGTWSERILARVEGQLDMILEACPAGSIADIMRLPDVQRLHRLRRRLCVRAAGEVLRRG